MTNIIDEIAQHIRIVDGNNAMDPHKLGNEIAGFLISRGLIVTEDDEIAVTNFAADYNHDKTMGAGRLAELIVAEFDLNKESR
jgi:hypothetical protein